MKYFQYIYLILTIICIITDYKYKKIYNKITFPGMAIGILTNILFLNSTNNLILSLQNAIYGIILGFILLFIPYYLGGMGAGDVKMLMMVGAFIGPKRIFIVFLISSISGLIYSITAIIKKNGIMGIIIAGNKILTKEFLKDKIKDNKAHTLPFAINIGIGTILEAIWNIIMY